MMLRFYRDERSGVPCFVPADDTYSALGSLMTGDIGNSGFGLLELLEGIELVRLDQSPREEWEGNGWAGAIRPDGLHLEDLHSDDWRGQYDLQTARAVSLAYLRFIVPESEARARVLARWEAANGHPHPARDNI